MGDIVILHLVMQLVFVLVPLMLRPTKSIIVIFKHFFISLSE